MNETENADLANLKRVIKMYSDCAPHPGSRAAYLLRYRDALETVGDEATDAVMRGCESLGQDWGPPLLALAEKVRARGGRP